MIPVYITVTIDQLLFKQKFFNNIKFISDHLVFPYTQWVFTPAIISVTFTADQVTGSPQISKNVILGLILLTARIVRKSAAVFKKLAITWSLARVTDFTTVKIHQIIIIMLLVFFHLHLLFLYFLNWIMNSCPLLHLFGLSFLFLPTSLQIYFYSKDR